MLPAANDVIEIDREQLKDNADVRPKLKCLLEPNCRNDKKQKKKKLRASAGIYHTYVLRVSGIVQVELS